MNYNHRPHTSDSMVKHTLLDLYYTLLDTNDILENEKDTLFRKHNHLFIQIGKSLIHFHFYSISISFEPFLNIHFVNPTTFQQMYSYHPSFSQIRMINGTTYYDFQKIIQEIKKLRYILIE